MSVQLTFMDVTEVAASPERTHGGVQANDALENLSSDASFSILTDASGGLAKLRRLIITLAVRGGLSSTTQENVARADVVGTWPEKPLAQCVDVLDSQRVPVNEAERAKRIAGKAPESLFPYFGATRQQGWIDSFLFDEDLVLLGEDGVPFLDPDRPKAYVIRGKTWVNNHAHVLRPRGMDPVFLCHALNSADYSDRITGTTRAKLTKGKMLDIPLPVPPLAEQKRIVTKVDQLMALCDELEARQTKQRELGTRLTKSALDALSTAETAEDFDVAWKRVAENFDVLTAVAETARHLRSFVLQRAVTLGFEGSRSTWSAGTLGDFASFLNGYAFKSEWFRTRGVPLVRNANVSHGTLDWTDAAYLDALRLQEFDRFLLSEGDIVVSLDRPLISTGVKVARVRRSDLPCLLLQRVAKVTPGRNLDPDYLFLWLTSPVFSGGIDPGRSNGVPHISTRQVQSLPMVVPPLAEQQRIVARVSQLMKSCDRLQSSLTRAEASASKLLEAVVRDLGA